MEVVFSLKILFVCTGNTCRSVMAEALARKLMSERFGDHSPIMVFSAGISAWPGDRPSGKVAQALAGLGASLHDHKASNLTPEKVREADLILTMTRSHLEFVKGMPAKAGGKVFTLAEFAGSGEDVPDPFGQSLDHYIKCARRLEDLVALALDRLES